MIPLLLQMMHVPSSVNDTWQFFDEPEDALCLVHERNLDQFPERLDAGRATLDRIQLCRLRTTQTSTVEISTRYW